MPFKILKKQCIINDNALLFLALLLILHYSLPILKNNDNAISLFLFSNAQGLVKTIIKKATKLFLRI